MTTKEDVDNFLTEHITYKGQRMRKHESLHRFSKAHHKNRTLADEAYSFMIMKLYEILPSLSDAYCYKVLRNYTAWGNKENRYEARACREFQTEDHMSTVSYNQLVRDAETPILLSDFTTFYAQELWREGVCTEEQIEKLDKLRSISLRLPPWAKELYNLLYIQGMTYYQVAKLKKIPTGSVFLKQQEMRAMIINMMGQFKDKDRLW